MSLVKLAKGFLKLPISHVKADGKEFNKIEQDAIDIQKNVKELKADDKQAIKDHKL